jgi:hypothetical protein
MGKVNFVSAIKKYFCLNKYNENLNSTTLKNINFNTIVYFSYGSKEYYLIYLQINDIDNSLVDLLKEEIVSVFEKISNINFYVLSSELSKPLNDIYPGHHSYGYHTSRKNNDSKTKKYLLKLAHHFNDNDTFKVSHISKVKYNYGKPLLFKTIFDSES